MGGRLTSINKSTAFYGLRTEHSARVKPCQSGINSDNTEKETLKQDIEGLGPERFIPTPHTYSYSTRTFRNASRSPAGWESNPAQAVCVQRRGTTRGAAGVPD